MGSPSPVSPLAQRNPGKIGKAGRNHRVVVYDPQQAAEAGETLKKGATVTVFEGSLRNRTWTDKAGIERQQTEVVISQSQGALLRPEGKKRHGPSLRQAARMRADPFGSIPLTFLLL